MVDRLGKRGKVWALAAGLGLILGRPAAAQDPPTLPRPRTLPEPAADAPPAAPAPLTLDALVGLSLGQNPRLEQLAFGIDAARGRAVQAGLYPNPSVEIRGDELGDRQGPGGIWTAPFVSQEIVTAGKLSLARAAAMREVDQARLNLFAELYALLGRVRQGYYEVLTLQRRAEILGELVSLAEQSVETTEKLLAAKQVARLDLVQLEVELERLRADRDATEGEIPAAFRRLAAAAGVAGLPFAPLAGSLEEALPEYDLEPAQQFVARYHPEVRAAEAGVERARLALQREQVEPIPNVTVGAGYVRQNQNQSDDWQLALQVPVPVWNRNQGNILAARARLGEAIREVERVRNDLTERLALAFREYAAARRRAQRYRDAILPRARETYQLSLKAYRGGQFEYLRVLTAQQSVAQANLEYNRALGEAWQAAARIGALLMEEHWPPRKEE